MKNIFILLSLFLAVNFAHSASFDCKKATTSHEKFICNSQELNEVDTQLGATYSSVLKSFKFPELIKEDQRSWLYEYRNCGALMKCLDLVKARINELKNIQGQLYIQTIRKINFWQVKGLSSFLMNRVR